MKPRTLKTILASSILSIVTIGVVSLTIQAFLTKEQSTKKYHYDATPIDVPLGSASQKELYPDDEFVEAMKPYPVLSEGLREAKAIPGLQGAWSLKDAADPTAVRPFVEVDTFDPQGIAVSANHIFISAYDHSHKANSVIFVLDKSDGSYQKTIVLDHQDHAGGVAYDPDRHVLWVAGHDKGGASVYAIDEATIENYDIKSQIPITYAASFDLATTSNTSTVSYYQDSLWVGFFTVKGFGNVQQFNIQTEDDGSFSIGEEVPGSKRKNDVMSTRMMKGINQLQGIAPTRDAVLMTSSYGNLNSKLVRYARAENDDLSDGHFVVMPPYLESVAWDGDTDRFYALFESSTPAYRKETNAVVDRVLFVDSANFLSKSQPYVDLRTPPKEGIKVPSQAVTTN